MSMIELPPVSPDDHRVIVLTIGLPGSGKSRWARKILCSEPNRWRLISRDDLRSMLWNGPFNGRKSDETIITQITETAVRSALAAGQDVILHNTHLDARSRKTIHSVAEEHGECSVMEIVFPVPVEECLRRNALREGIARVPDDVILQMAKKASVAKDGRIGQLENSETVYLTKGNYDGPEMNDPTLPPAVICDLDGTIALMNGRNPYDASRCEEDLVNQPVLDVLEKFYASHHIIFMSGRSSKYRPQTEAWLKKHVQGHPIYEYELFMRAEGDMRKDSIVKYELFMEHVAGKYFVNFWLDDRDQVVRMARRSLEMTVFQVAEGNF